MSFAALRPGALVGVVAPAGPARPEALAAVPALYARHGLRVRLFPCCQSSTGYLAGPDAERLADLHAALDDDEVAAIHCLRGGYGALRLLPDIDTALLRRKPKLLIGYSDITALHALWAREGLASLHAPMPASDLVLAGHADDERALFELLTQGLLAGAPLGAVQTAGALCAPGTAEGPLVGGNLSLVAALMGTPWAWDARGAILFLEDVGEQIYRVDRLLTQLRLGGVLDAAAGFVLGSFTEQEPPEDLLREILLPICLAQGKPLVAGWPSGHGTPNRPLPLGVRATLDVPADGGAARLTLRQDFIGPAGV